MDLVCESRCCQVELARSIVRRQPDGMKTIPYHGFPFPKAIIQHAVWLYLRFTLSLRDVEGLVTERSIRVTCETVRIWVAHFGPLVAKRLRRRRGPSSGIWHLGEVFVKVAGRQARPQAPVQGLYWRRADGRLLHARP